MNSSSQHIPNEEGESDRTARVGPLTWITLLSIPLIAWSRDIAVATLVLCAAVAFSQRRKGIEFPGAFIKPTVIIFLAFAAWSAATLLWSPAPAFLPWLKATFSIALSALLGVGVSRLPRHVAERLVFPVALATLLLFGVLTFERITDGALIGLARPGETAFQRITVLTGGLVLLCCTCFPCAALMARAARTALAGPAWIFAVACLCLAFPTDAQAVSIGAGALAFLFVFLTGRVGALATLGILGLGMVGWGFLAEGAAALGLHRWLTTNFDPNWGYRIEIWRYVSELIRAQPFQGYGFDSARAVGQSAGLQPAFDGRTTFLHPHNGMLQIWLELGAVGVFLLLAGAISGFGAFFKKKHKRATDAMVTAATVTTGIIWSLSFGVWQGWWLAVLGLTAVSVVFATLTETNIEKRAQHTKPRLLFLATEYYFFDALKKELTPGPLARGFDIFVAARCDTGQQSEFSDNITVVPFHWRRSSSLLRSALHFLPDLYRVRRLLRDLNPDIVHNIGLKPSIVGSIATFGLRPKVINAIHGFGFIFMGKGLSQRLVQKFCGFVLRLSTRWNNAILVLINRGDFARAENDMGIAAQNLRLIRGTGVDVDTFRPLPEPPTPPFRFLVIGRLLYMKGIQTAIDAQAMLRARGLPVELMLCGSTDPGNPSSIPDSVLNSWKRHPGVTFAGQVADVRPILAQCHVFLLPSLGGEGLPRVLTEAAACERPLIATDIPGNNEVAIQGKTGLLVPPGDVDALATAMQWIMDHPQDRVRFARAGRALVLQTFSSDQIARSHAALYEDGACSVPAQPTENAPA